MKILPIITLAAISTASLAQAATVPMSSLAFSRTSAGANIDGACGSPDTVVSDTAASVSGSGPGCSMTAAASAGSGFSAATTSHNLFNGSGATRYGSTASATATYYLDLGVSDDYIYSGPELVTVNFTATSVTTAFFDDTERNLFTTAANGFVSGFVSLTGSTNNISLQNDRREFSNETVVSRDTADPDSEGKSTSDGVPISLSIVTDPRRTLTITMGISANAGVVGPNSATVKAVGDGGNTLSFATDRPVFEVSDGLLVDFADLNIIGNRWVDPRALDPIDPSPIPLPAGLPLLLASLGALGLIRRRA